MLRKLHYFHRQNVTICKNMHSKFFYSKPINSSYFQNNLNYYLWYILSLILSLYLSLIQTSKQVLCFYIVKYLILMLKTILFLKNNFIMRLNNNIRLLFEYLRTKWHYIQSRYIFIMSTNNFAVEITFQFLYNKRYM